MSWWSKENDSNNTKKAKSISVTANKKGIIYISDDKLYAGGDNCKDCRFNPCYVKKWYRGKGIEDCDLWNKENPVGTIKDIRR